MKYYMIDDMEKIPARHKKIFAMADKMAKEAFTLQYDIMIKETKNDPDFQTISLSEMHTLFSNSASQFLFQTIKMFTLYAKDRGHAFNVDVFMKGLNVSLSKIIKHSKTELYQ